MSDLADFVDELDALIMDHLAADVDREAIKATLAAKLQQMHDEEIPIEEDTEKGENGENA